MTSKIEGGKIAGKTEEGIHVFKGIPYAASPTGDFRWKPPQPIENWAGTRICEDFGPVCPQAEYPKTSIYRISSRTQSEDCLYLNVWTSSTKQDAKMPVMVWIHGGNLNRGSACLPHYDGLNLAKEGVVLVSINYRVGIFGFLAHPELSKESEREVSGNYGLLDQIAALTWVQNNIGAFGGDPNQVTIFGESAGSWSVNALLASPLAKGLFHRAIGQSGAKFYGERHLKKKSGRKEAAEDMGARFMQKLSANTLGEMRACSAQQLLDVSFQEAEEFTADFVVDAWAIPQDIHQIFSDKKQHTVPLLIGSNDREWSGFVDLKALPKDLTSYKKLIKKRYPSKTNEFFKAYPAHSDKEILLSHLTHWGDLVFALQVRKWARAATQSGQEVFLYYFRREPNSRHKAFLGAFHAAEIPYVFKNLAKVPNHEMYEALDYELSDLMSAYWLDFAKGDFEKHSSIWKSYEEGEEHYMDFGDESELKQYLHKERLDVLEGLVGG